MPRSAAVKKNQHNQRHENGLVGPGKRINKQRSNGQLNGAAKGAALDTPLPTLIPSAESPVACHATNGTASALSDPNQETSVGAVHPGPRMGSSGSSADCQPAHCGSAVAFRESEDVVSHRCDTPALKTNHTTDVGTLQLASAILKSCPAYDTVAMLILLLQLPPIFLTLVQALFASLTFMPPNGLSMTSVLTLFDVFQGSAGMPSLGTMIAVDALCLGGWFCLWNWARTFALDLAQVQIAITLGGGNVSRAGSMNSVCVAIVLFLHLVRSKSVRQFFIAHVISARLPANFHATPVSDYVPTKGEIDMTPQPPTWYRSLFAIHIITQAGIAIIRRNVASTQVTTTPKPSKRVDTEALAGAQVGQDIAPLEPGAGAVSNGTPDLHSPPTPLVKESKDRVISTKRRKRQANQVRSSQPFWAALASTKVNALREIEIARPLSNSAVPPPDNVPGSPMAGFSQIRLTSVNPSSIKFEVINLPVDMDDQESGLSYPKRLFVRVNGAYWPSTSISQPPSDRYGDPLSGVISGLAPNCTYTCTFTIDNDQEIIAIMAKTPVLPDKDPLPPASSPAIHHSQRPLSPVTTVRQSIGSTEAMLGETRSRATKIRRAHKAALTRLEKEVEVFSARLKSSSDDTKQRQKLLQAERTLKQNEDTIQTLSAALNDLSTIPEEDADNYSMKRDAYKNQRGLLATVNDSLAAAKSLARSEVATPSEELKALGRQRERLLARHARLNEQHERITQANLQGLNEMERKAGETLAKERDHSRLEAEYSNQFNIFQRELTNVSMRTQQAKQECQAIESHLMIQQHQNSITAGLALTPEGNLPGTYSSGKTNPFATGQSTPSGQPLLPSAPRSPESSHATSFPTYNCQVPFHNDESFRLANERGRSSSNRSGGASSSYSADLEDADPLPPMPGLSKLGLDGKRKGSGGSGGAKSTSPDSPIAAGDAEQIDADGLFGVNSSGNLVHRGQAE